MRRWRHGLVVGKFRPPHRGHGLLIETALARVEQLTVMVFADVSDTLPVDLRAGWLRELYPTADVRVYVSTGLDPDDSRLWAELTRMWLGRAPDVVFSSEDYGERYAHFLGCEHVSVDPGRTRVPISASRVLARPLAHLDFLAPCVRAHFIPRIAIVGADSTGKTTLARALAARYGTTWVPEYGRTYWDGLLTLPRIVSALPDYLHIVATQHALEDHLARHANRVLLCDTDALTTRLWHERLVGFDAPELRALVRPDRYALYLLTGGEVPWEADGTREALADRAQFHGRFGQELATLGVPVVEVAGPPEDRLRRAGRAIDRLLAAGGDPLASAEAGGA